MLRLNRWIAAVLAACIILNTIPVYAFAETEESSSTEEMPSEVPEAPQTLTENSQPSEPETTTSTQETQEVTEPTQATETTTPPQETQEVTEPTQATETITPPQETQEVTEPTQATETTTSPQETQEVTEPTQETEPQETTSETLGEDEIELAAEGDIPEVGDTFADGFIVLLNEKKISTTITKGEDGVITLTIGEGQGEILALLSQQEQTADSNYQNWNINFSLTGDLVLPDNFNGLGDEGFGFCGSFSGAQITLQSSVTIFKELYAKADLHDVKVLWTGDRDKPILTKNLIADAGAHEIKMPLVPPNDDKAKQGEFSPYIGKLTGDSGMVTLPTLDYSKVQNTNSTAVYTDSVGLVCGEMGPNTKLAVGQIKLPSISVSLTSSTGDVGSLVGRMGEGAMLTINDPLTLNATLNGKNAGGMVGSMANATINFTAEKTVTVNATLTAAEAAGGIAGAVTTATGPLGTNANVVLNTVKANGTLNSGILYGTCSATGEFSPLTRVSFSENSVREVSGPGNCGGLFGTLTLTEDGKCTISGTEEAHLSISSTLTAATNTTQYGGIAGTLYGDDRKNALVVNYCDITFTIGVKDSSKYLGGIVAVQGESTTVDAKNSETTVQNPKVSSGGYGGICGSVGISALLIAENMATKTEFITDLTYPSGGGVAGSTNPGSIVYLKTTLDLSECALETAAASGQIIGKQDSSLIYAPDDENGEKVAIKRLNTTLSYNNQKLTGVELDDIGNYGELYRIPGLVNVSYDGNYTVGFLQTLVKNEAGVYALSGALDYACLALAWQSRGAFPTVDGIDSTSWAGLISSTITLGADINLTGCGIGGLTRDAYSADDTFSGTFNGNDRTLTLDIGAKNSFNSVSNGDGRIYWHNSTGLFAALDSSATVSNLNLAGNIRLSNNKLTSGMYSGALAAQVRGSRDKGSTLSKASTSVNYDVNANGANTLYLGGLIGLISGGIAKMDLDTGTSLASTIIISHFGNGAYNHIGGAIGGIDSKASVTLTCNGTTLGGKIESTGSINNLYAGGLVGTIVPANGSTRAITLTKLTVNSFSLTGTASERMGGILGGIWADTTVSIDGLTITSSTDESGVVTPGATLTASGAAELGGLVYRASGKWTVSSVDLSGLTINAGSASALGLMVCHGEPYTEPINGTQSVGGLYLEMTEYWNTGYRVPTITFNDSGFFDEFVAYTAYRYSDGSYDITHNGSGVISLKTTDGKVHMTSEVRNTYVNRTAVGQSKQTNPYSRYYYNLPTVMTDCDGGGIDTAAELLIWSVYRYAASNLKQLFCFDGVEKSKGVAVSDIGGTSSQRASFNMEGFSYYPINITNESITVKYSDVTFYNDAIETKESGNKLTRQKTQHYTMHCALFLNFTAENNAQSPNYQLTVNGVSFAGTVGVVNGGSGALICGNVAGQSLSGNTSICKVILGNASDAVTLKGISVEGADKNGYAPVLINKIGSYSTLEALHITTTAQHSTAGSSLIGDVGGENATNVTVTFSGTIRLPETKGVFAKATLLNSLRYADGSGTYTFTSTQDHGEHNTTHGYELSESVEYAGKCGYYDDDESKIPYPTGQEDFTSYLPYVANSPATSDTEYPLSGKWHELAVNIHSEPLTEGCGTYGHPYQVTAKELREAAHYLNTGVASTGWQIRVPEDGAYHSSGEDILLTYQNGGWKDAEGNAYNKDVRKHLQSAYYQLVYAKDENGNPVEATITLDNFPGIGTNPDWAFKGVITGKNGDANVSVTLGEGTSAFIKYSYGSVVRDVNIQMDHDLSLTHVYPTTTNNITAAQQAPETFFGGVIGCVLGGDNIIENVTFSSSGITVEGTGTYAHLVPIGGYVGVIAGGGVIFRGNYANVNTGIKGTTAQLYSNPIIGRVLGGYAFYEGNVTPPDNGNQDYKINTLSGSDHLSWDGSTVIVNDAQGLLILSAIVSSGAGSTSSNAYIKGVARNAKYDKIGQVAQPDDYTTAKKDAGEVWQNANTPYLLAEYASYTGNASICTGTVNGIVIQFKSGATFDMNGYGNGYRGLSARYVSNAAFVGGTVTPSAVVLRVKTFDGQNATVQNINMDVREYNNDDFHMASMGGIFNIVWTQKQSGGGGVGSNFAQNLTLQDCNVQLKYVKSDGIDAYCASYESSVPAVIFDDIEGRSGVSVGGFIGSANDMTSDINVNVKTSNYLFSNIHIKGTSDTKGCSITGPNAAGGLIGTTAMTYGTVKGYPGVLLSNSQNAQFAPSLLNCSYENINVTAQFSAGGMIGHVNARKGTPTFGSLGESATNNENPGWYASFTVTDSQLVVGKDSDIKAEAWGSVAGGIYAATGMRNLFNAPDVDTKTGLTIQGDKTIQTLKLEGVNVSAYTESRTIKAVTDGAVTNNGNSEIAAGGITARHGSQNPSWYYNISLLNCKVETKNKTDKEYAGGIVGSGYTNQKLVMEQCKIKDTTIDSKNAGGFLGYGYSYSTDTVFFEFHLSDCRIEGSTVKGSTCSGGIAGVSQGKYYFYNILITNTSVTGGTCWRLLGNASFKDANAKKGFELYAAGISVYTNPHANSQILLPDNDLNLSSYTGYIAYADYAGTEREVTGQKSPYVAVNPNFHLDGTTKTLYGDAVGKIESDNTYKSVAARIWADNQPNPDDRENLVAYQNVTEIVKKDIPKVSTFAEIQGCGPENLPVLTIEDGNADVVADYLDVITNGAYSKAGVTPTVTVYYYDQQKRGFIEEVSGSDRLKKEPAALFYSQNAFHVLSGGYDNTRSRFSLVEASFTVNINGVDRTYTVSVPVIVIREMQYNYMVTFSYGREFKKDVYDSLKNHILESAGNPFTAYLTYQYNKKENGVYADYDWQAYLNAGGNMMGDKELRFSSTLPVGTTMILLDCQNGNQAYQYRIPDGSSGNQVSVMLSQFQRIGESGNFQASLGDALGLTATESTDGAFVVTSGDGAIVRVGDTCYRQYDSQRDGENTQRYTITVPPQTDKNAAESYYLVITVPNPPSDVSQYSFNGRLTSSLNMPSKGWQIHRYDKSSNGVGSNDESTYQISKGYQQALSMTAEAPSGAIDLGSNPQAMKIRVQDTITFSNEQVYDTNDKLFLKLTVNLQEDTGSASAEKQFPVGTTGTVKFYVQNEAGDTYYSWNGTQWVSQSDKIAAASYPWSSKGDNMELLLSADGTNALDLSGVRKLIKGTQNTGDSKIIVTAEMDIAFGSAEVLNAAVPASDQSGTDTWAQLHYLGQISTQETSLSYSAMRATATDNAKYYRGVKYEAVLSMDALYIDQLGVNPLQLVPDYQETIDGRNASRIDLTAALNLANLQDIKSVLANTHSITFTLSLKRRKGENYVDVESASNYIKFDKGRSWAIQQDQYYQNGAIVTSDIFDGTQFTIPIKAYVFTDQKDYANYQIKLSVSFANSSNVSVTDSDANVIYTYACIKPSFYEPPKSTGENESGG